MDKKKIDYICILNAVAIIAVMIGHLDLTTANDPNMPLACLLERFGTFQMPLFMCISGWLFVRSKIFHANWLKLVISKIKRLFLPFLFLSIFTLCFKLCLPSSMLEHGVGLTGEYITRMFLIPFRGPVPHLWFVISLLTMFMLSPLYKWSLNGIWTTLLMTIVFASFTFLPPVLGVVSLNPEYLSLDHTQMFFVYFFLGMAIQKYEIHERLNN